MRRTEKWLNVSSGRHVVRVLLETAGMFPYIVSLYIPTWLDFKMLLKAQSSTFATRYHY